MKEMRRRMNERRYVWIKDMRMNECDESKDIKCKRRFIFFKFGSLN